MCACTIQLPRGPVHLAKNSAESWRSWLTRSSSVWMRPVFFDNDQKSSGRPVRLAKNRLFSACRDTASEPLPGHQHPCYSAPRDTILIADKMNTLVTACQCYARCALQRLRWPHSALRRDRPQTRIQIGIRRGRPHVTRKKCSDSPMTQRVPLTASQWRAQT